MSTKSSNPNSLPPSCARIDLGAIRANFKTVQRHVGPDCRLMAIVKTDGYGHGMIEAARAAQHAGAQHLGVASLDEAAQLRRASVQCPILVLGPILASEVGQAADLGVALTIGSLDLTQALDHCAQERHCQIPVHVKFDTGMGRLGFWHEEAPTILRRMLSFAGLELEGILTHFSDADQPDSTHAKSQIQSFQQVLDSAAQLGINFRYIHAANSGAIIHLPESHFNMARLGIMLYGSFPSNLCRRPFDLKPAMTVTTTVTQLRQLPADSYISYGRTFRTTRSTRVAILPFGYGHGFSICASNQGDVLIRGRSAPILGRVCMDLTVTDVSDIEDVEVGDRALVFGRDSEHQRRVEDIAAKLDTIPYEVLCHMGRILPRFYEDSTEKL